MQRLAALEPRTLAIMHGSSLNTGCAAALRAYAEGLARHNLAAAA
jgi:hypothetical protein